MVTLFKEFVQFPMAYSLCLTVSKNTPFKLILLNTNAMGNERQERLKNLII
jgi:hypothetical protein